MLSKSLFTLAVLASSAFAALTFTSAPSTVAAGQTVTIGYSTDDATTPVQIVLRKGNPADLQTIGTLTAAASGGSYSWTVPADTPSGTDYALEIIQGTNTNYFGPFSVTGGTAPTSSAGSSSTGSVTAKSGSSSVSSTAVSSALTISAKSTSTHVSNSTVTTKSSVTTGLSTSKITSSAGAATATSAPNGASSISSPLALILGAVAAMFYLH